jgi:hypothetical protein
MTPRNTQMVTSFIVVLCFLLYNEIRTRNTARNIDRAHDALERVNEQLRENSLHVGEVQEKIEKYCLSKDLKRIKEIKDQIRKNKNENKNPV